MFFEGKPKQVLPNSLFLAYNFYLQVSPFQVAMHQAIQVPSRDQPNGEGERNTTSRTGD